MNKCWINKLHRCPHEPCLVFTARQCFWLLFFFDLAANCCSLRDTSFYQVLSFDVDTWSAGGNLAWALVGSVNLPVSPAVQITNGTPLLGFFRWRSDFTPSVFLFHTSLNPPAPLTTRSMTSHKCHRWCYLDSNWRHKRALRLWLQPITPHLCLWLCSFRRETPTGKSPFK